MIMGGGIIRKSWRCVKKIKWIPDRNNSLKEEDTARFDSVELLQRINIIS